MNPIRANFGLGRIYMYIYLATFLYLDTSTYLFAVSLHNRVSRNIVSVYLKNIIR